MNNTRLLLYIAFFVSIMTLWSSWQSQTVKKAATSQHSYLQTDKVQISQGEDDFSINNPIPKDRLIHVKTDLFSMKIDKLGGKIVSLHLLNYPKSLHNSDSIQLLNSDPKQLYQVVNRVRSQKSVKDSKPPLFIADKAFYQFSDNQNVLQVVLKGKTSEGLLISKTFLFRRGRYAVPIHLSIKNSGHVAWVGQIESKIQKKKTKARTHRLGLNTYRGFALYTPDSIYKKLSYKKIDKEGFDKKIDNGWIAAQQRYFLTALIPEPGRSYHYYAKSLGNDYYVMGLLSSRIDLQPNQSYDTSAVFYAGPEDVNRLKLLSKGLDRTVDFGWLWFISLGVLWLLEKIHAITGNWGWSILLVTLLIKLVFFKLSESSYRSMGKMKTLQPRLQQLQARHGNDKQALSQATMALYRDEKVNPLGGCLPFIVQIPIFIALYYVLMESIALRQAPFFAWIQDLSAKDPYYILPILMGLSMLMQQRLNPTPADPTQAKMMWVLPIVFTLLFFSFPSGLVLYWLANNCFSAFQQWYIMKKMKC